MMCLKQLQEFELFVPYVQERSSEKQFADMTEDVFKKNMHVEKIDAMFMPISKILTGLTYMIGLGYGAYLVSEGDMTLGNLVTFNVYLSDDCLADVRDW